MRMTTILLVMLLLILSVMVLLGDVTRSKGNEEVQASRLTSGEKPVTFMLVHGFSPDEKRWKAVGESLEPHGEVLRLTYQAGPSSNASPAAIAANIGKAIESHVASTGRSDIVIVAHSMGAPLARRALLDGLKSNAKWASSVHRMVLLAGMNRGWTTEGESPPDASRWQRLKLRFGQWLAGVLRRGQLFLDLQRGAPFVSNLRLEWMKYMRDAKSGPLEVVQLLGDIDDFVSRDDNEDLRTAAVGNFALLRVRGTGHGDIIEFGLGGQSRADQLGKYRRNKLVLAATGKFDAIRAQSEALAPPVVDSVTELIIVLHGIRDLGRWSAAFEREVRALQPPRGKKVVFLSPRYGYLGMGPFLFQETRDRYVRWFMDEYTEALAKYPQLKPEKVHVFGHSNGSYLLADALRKYDSMTVGNVVLAGSVVASDYHWSCLSGRVGAIRSYAGTHDLVVAWFPRLFELPVFNRLQNRLGGGGFHGFEDPRVDNVLIYGGHGAFEGQEKAIVEFLMQDNRGSAPADSLRGTWKKDRPSWGDALASTPIVLLVWALLAGVLSYVGLRVVSAAAAPVWPVLLAYLLILVTLLRTV